MFRRRFHQAGLARFTYKVSSLKMMDLSSLFLPIAFGFLPPAFAICPETDRMLQWKVGEYRCQQEWHPYRPLRFLLSQRNGCLRTVLRTLLY